MIGIIGHTRDYGYDVFQVRSEMSTSDQEVEELKKLERKKKEREEREKKRTVSFNEEASIKSKLGSYTIFKFFTLFYLLLLAKDIYSALFQTKAPEKNEFFLPGRMVITFTYCSMALLCVLHMYMHVIYSILV